MFDSLELKSRAVSIFDFRKVDFKDEYEPFETDEEALEADLLLIRKQHSDTVTSETAAEGDFVRISCESENPRYNKKSIFLTVGKNIFNREIEEALIGMHVGEEKTVFAEKDKVSFTVLDIQRRIVPNLTDENVALWDIENTKTVDELKKVLIKKQYDEYCKETVQSLSSYIVSETARKSEIIPDEEDVEYEKNLAHNMGFDMIRSMGADPESMSDEEISKIIGADNKIFLQNIEKVCLDDLYASVLGFELMKKSGDYPSQQDYKNALKEQMEYKGISEDEAQKQYTPVDFFRAECSNYCYDTVGAYLKEFFDNKEI